MRVCFDARVCFRNDIQLCTITLIYDSCPQGTPTRAYEVVVDHTKRIRAATAGFPGSWNDKTIVRFDGPVQALRCVLVVVPIVNIQFLCIDQSRV